MGDGKKLNIIGIFKRINLREIPGNYLKCVLVGNFGLLNKRLKELNINVRLIDPDKKPVGSPIPPFRLPVAIKEGKRLEDVNFTLELGNLKFETEGKYRFEIAVNGELLGEYKFEVKHQ